jgi:hypothetical protein
VPVLGEAQESLLEWVISGAEKRIMDRRTVKDALAVVVWKPFPAYMEPATPGVFLCQGPDVEGDMHGAIGSKPTWPHGVIRVIEPDPIRDWGWAAAFLVRFHLVFPDEK